jgi:hypothetical protein
LALKFGDIVSQGQANIGCRLFGSGSSCFGGRYKRSIAPTSEFPRSRS